MCVCVYIHIYIYTHTGVLINPQPDQLPDVFCLMVRINISFDASLVLYIYIYIYIYSTNISPIIIINRIYENQNLLSLQLVSFLVRLRAYQHSCNSYCGHFQASRAEISTALLPTVHVSFLQMENLFWSAYRNTQSVTKAVIGVSKFLQLDTTDIILTHVPFITLFR